MIYFGNFITMAIQQIGEFWQRSFAIGSTVYSYTLFWEINNDRSFHISEDCQNLLL